MRPKIRAHLRHAPRTETASRTRRALPQTPTPTHSCSVRRCRSHAHPHTHTYCTVYEVWSARAVALRPTHRRLSHRHRLTWYRLFDPRTLRMEEEKTNNHHYWVYSRFTQKFTLDHTFWDIPEDSRGIQICEKGYAVFARDTPRKETPIASADVQQVAATFRRHGRHAPKGR